MIGTTKVSSAGQVFIPKKIRQKLKLKSGTEIVMTIVANGLMIRINK